MRRAEEAEDQSIPEETWAKLLGSHNWEGLLDPLDLNLRKFILRCGDRCHAANDTFAGKPLQLPDNCKFHSDLYATPSLLVHERILQRMARNSGSRIDEVEDHHESTWMGYCAVTARSNSRREILIAWRGTKKLSEWRNNVVFTPKSAERLLRPRPLNERKEKKTPRVMRGWLSIYTSVSKRVKVSARDQVKAAVEKHCGKNRSKGDKISVVVTGHSLGGILAVLTAFDIAENLVGEEVQVVAVVFGCPRVGNKEFGERLKRHPNLKVLHVKNKKDVVTCFPPLGSGVGTELVVDSGKSDIPKLRDSKNMGLNHDLETFLYMVAGWNGEENEFELKDVNRSSDRLMESTKAFDYNRREIENFFSQIGSKIKHKFYKLWSE